MRREWTCGEIEALRTLAPFGARAIADSMGRTERSVRVKAAELSISLRIRHGIIKTYTRQDLTDGLRRRLDADTCPRCGLRPIGVKTTGLCGVCHYKALSDDMRERRATEDAQREYEREKKSAQRRVRCQECGREYSPRTGERKSDRAVCPECRGDA